jgi:RNA polymerase sigma-70 factor (ECF subfamily)
VAGPGYAEATRLLHDQHVGACLALARRVLGDREKAEDVVQEAFLDAWRHVERFDPQRSSMRSWLLMLTHRKAVDRVRHDALRATVSLGPTEQICDPARGPEQLALAALLTEPVHRAMARLPAVQREALVLAYWGGLTQREIAAATRCPIGTVKTRTRNGMLTLARLLHELAQETAPDRGRLVGARSG